MNTITDRITLTNEQIEARFADAGAELALDYGDDENVTVTAETLAEVVAARAGWATAGTIERNADGTLVIAGMQLLKGDPRRTLYVVDFGDVRLAYSL